MPRIYKLAVSISWISLASLEEVAFPFLPIRLLVERPYANFLPILLGLEAWPFNLVGIRCLMLCWFGHTARPPEGELIRDHSLPTRGAGELEDN